MYTWLPIKKFVRNKLNNNNYNNIRSNHPIINSYYNITNTNLKENEGRPRKKDHRSVCVYLYPVGGKLPFFYKFPG